jgi:Nitroreductase family
MLNELLVWRRDVRHFHRDPSPDGLPDQPKELACLAPSVGFSQPWRWVTVDDVRLQSRSFARWNQSLIQQPQLQPYHWFSRCASAPCHRLESRREGLHHNALRLHRADEGAEELAVDKGVRARQR